MKINCNGPRRNVLITMFLCQAFSPLLPQSLLVAPQAIPAPLFGLSVSLSHLVRVPQMDCSVQAMSTINNTKGATPDFVSSLTSKIQKDVVSFVY